MKTIHEVLIANGWDFLYGHSLGYGRNPDYDNVIIERSEVETLIKQTPQYFYFQDGDDVVKNEEDAWETLFEDWCEKQPDEDYGNLDFKDWERKMLE